MATVDLRHQVARAIEPYRALLQAFVNGELSADEFERRYLDTYLNDNDLDCSFEVFQVVDGFFASVDSYVGDPALREDVDRGIGPGELRGRAEELLRAAGLATGSRA